jgi:hypothetical protein
MTDLPIEKEILCQSIAIRVRQMNESEVRQLLIDTYRRLIELDAAYLPKIRKQWGIDR